MNTLEALANVKKLINELDGLNDRTLDENRDKVDYHRHKTIRYNYRTGKRKYAFKIDEIFDEVGIFDWWGDTLSVSQLKQMRAFLEQAHKLGFDGYVCFKVGAVGCSHGMWAHKNDSTTGYSPEGDCLFHSFRSGDCYWDMYHNGQWMHEKETDGRHDHKYNLSQIKAELAKA